VHIDINLLIVLTLHIGVVLAFACYGTQLLAHRSILESSTSFAQHSLSELSDTYRIRRPVRRYFIPRMRVKRTTCDDEPPFSLS
jgi:hypothetical protein